MTEPTQDEIEAFEIASEIVQRNRNRCTPFEYTGGSMGGKWGSMIQAPYESLVQDIANLYREAIQRAEKAKADRLNFLTERNEFLIKLQNAEKSLEEYRANSKYSFDQEVKAELKAEELEKEKQALALMVEKMREALEFGINSVSCHHGGHLFNDPECPINVLKRGLSLTQPEALKRVEAMQKVIEAAKEALKADESAWICRTRTALREALAALDKMENEK